MRAKHKFFVCLTRKAMLLIFMALPAAALKGQNARVVFPANNITIGQAFDEIEKQTDYLMSVNHTGFDISRKVKLSRNNLTVHDAMQQLLAHTGRLFGVYGHHIVVYAPNEPTPPAITAQVPEVPAEVAPEVELPPMPEIDLTKPPVDVDSLELALKARKVEFPAEIPPVPHLNTTAYYNQRDIEMAYTGKPAYVTSLPKLALRTNLLYDFGALTPNLGVDIALSPHSTVLVAGSYNGWGLNDDDRDKMLCHWTASVEYRYWLCERFNGHFFGLHGYGGNYHIKGVRIPLLMEKGSEDYRYKGNVYGAGISYGYQMLLGASWNLEANVGIGFGMTEYDKYDCDRCGDTLEEGLSKTFVAPTKLGISLVYIIKSKK